LERYRVVPSVRTTECLPKSHRIAKRRDFLLAYDAGRKTFGRYVVIFARPNDLGHPRLGITATRKIGKANVRNRMKRWTREVFRRNQTALGLEHHGTDFVVNLRKDGAATEFDSFRADLVSALERAARTSGGPSKNAP
jgi:ribonuclease P protein component